MPRRATRSTRPDPVRATCAVCPIATSAGPLRVTPLHHATFLLEFGGKAISGKPNAVIDFYGPSDLTAEWNQRPRVRSYLSGFLGGSLDRFPGRYAAASPINHVSPDDAPTFIAQGTADTATIADSNVAFDQALKSFLLTNDADAARNALSAGFVAEEGGDPEKNLFEVDGVIKQHDDTGTKRRTDRPCSLESKRYIELVGRNESAGGTAEQNCLEPSIACDAAS